MKVRHIVDEKVLLLQLKTGNEQAFEQLYNLYSVRLHGFLLKLVKDDEIAQDLLQDIFIKIWENRETFDTRKNFRPYLFRVAENSVIDFFRKVACNKKLEMKLSLAFNEVYSHIEETIFSRENGAILNQAIEQLPPQCKLVFTLCKLEGKSYKEVSQMLGISVATISNHLQKAAQVIRQKVLLSDYMAVVFAYLINRYF